MSGSKGQNQKEMLMTTPVGDRFAKFQRKANIASFVISFLFVCLFCSVAEKGAEGCKDLMEAFAACVKSAAEGTS